MDIQSKQYKPSEEWCCEQCVFGTGEHTCDVIGIAAEMIGKAAAIKLCITDWKEQQILDYIRSQVTNK
jgi:hypothetical protein